MQAVERGFLYLQCLSFFVLIIVLLAGFFLKIDELQAIGVIYGLMLMSPLFMNRNIEVEKNMIVGILIGIPSLIICSALFGLIAKNFEVMGVLKIAEWSTEEASKYSLTVKLGDLALALGIAPITLLRILTNIPAPVAEESFFRVYLINSLSDIIGVKKTLIAQAILFGVTHWFAYSMDITGLASASMCGLILGVLYLKTGSETAVSLSHMVYNMLVVLLTS